MKGEKRQSGKKLQKNVNHSGKRCSEAGEWIENQWESMSNHLARESISWGEQERETAARREKREKDRDEETENK